MKAMHISHDCCGHGQETHAGHARQQGCCGFTRQHITKDERREALEGYRDQLKLELAGVEERLEELK